MQLQYDEDKNTALPPKFSLQAGVSERFTFVGKAVIRGHSCYKSLIPILQMAVEPKIKAVTPH